MHQPIFHKTNICKKKTKPLKATFLLVILSLRVNSEVLFPMTIDLGRKNTKGPSRCTKNKDVHLRIKKYSFIAAQALK